MKPSPQVLDVEEGMPKVLEGRYTFVSVKNHISVIVASLYTDPQGQTPIYISSKGIYTLPDYGWGFRCLSSANIFIIYSRTSDPKKVVLMCEMFILDIANYFSSGHCVSNSIL